MTNHHERIYALLVEANPVEDPEQAREIIDRRERLTLVKPRRQKMTDRREMSEPGGSPKRPRWLVPFAAAAAVVLFVGVLTALVAPGDPEGEDITASSTTTLAPTTTPAPPTTQAPPTTEVPPPTEAPTTTATTPPQVREARITVDADGCRYEGPDSVNVRDIMDITVANDSGRYLFLDVYRFRPDFSTEDLPGLAATPDRALEAQYEFGSVEVFLRAEAGSENNTVYLNPESLTDTGDFVLRFDRSYGFICWSAPGSNPNSIDGGAAAADGFSVFAG